MISKRDWKWISNKGNSAPRPPDKCRTELGPIPSRVVVTRDGASLFAIVPTVTDRFRGVVLTLRALCLLLLFCPLSLFIEISAHVNVFWRRPMAPLTLARFGHSRVRDSV